MFFLALACSSDFGQVAEAATIGSSPATPANTGRVPPQSHKKPLQVVVGHTGAQLEEKMFLKKAGGANRLDLAVADNWTQRNSELDDIIYPGPAEYEALHEARWKKGLKYDNVTQDQLPDGDYTLGEVSKKAYLKLCAERFDHVSTSFYHLHRPYQHRHPPPPTLSLLLPRLTLMDQDGWTLTSSNFYRFVPPNYKPIRFG